MPNRLINESSPYLRQHAHNPVDWYPWGAEALERARQDDRPIFLSIGYSACHWCHVMERESFQDPETARFMNEHFVNIKVDREERPDLDSLYMQAVQALSGQGGWPLSVFLTPQGEPFYGGTYFPPEERHGHPAFRHVLVAVAEAYRDRRGLVTDVACRLVSQLRLLSQPRPGDEPLAPELLSLAAARLASSFDAEHGGFGVAPKFPQPMVLEFLLRHWKRTGEQALLQMVERTLEEMALGGIYDHVGGGFHRYSTDQVWLVPHFEKMLYDNALLARLYLHAFQATGRLLYRRVAEETLDYVLRDMSSPEGGIFSTQDADSEGREGLYYLWTPAELAAVLGAKDGELFGRVYGVLAQGNFEGRSILHLSRPLDEVAQELGMAPVELEAFVAAGRARLLAARYRRVPPARDEKVLAGWNGLAVRSFAEVGAALRRADYVHTAEHAATFVLERMRVGGRLMRSYKDGRASHKAYLEDYAMLADGLLALYEATLQRRWLDEARGLASGMLELFWDEASGAFYDTGTDHEALVARPRDVFDNATPCGSSIAVDVLLRLAALTGERDLALKAARTVRSVRDLLVVAPDGMGHWLCAVDFYLSTPKEIVIVGDTNDPATQALQVEVTRRYLPNWVVAGWDGLNDEAAQGIPLLEGRGLLSGRPVTYVCQDYVCKLPVTTPDMLAAQLDP